MLMTNGMPFTYIKTGELKFAFYASILYKI